MARTFIEERLYVREAKLRKYAADHPELVTPARTYISNTTGGAYIGTSMSATRAGADDHLQIKSLGLGVQVKVRTV